jgi:hypothetical protein
MIYENTNATTLSRAVKHPWATQEGGYEPWGSTPMRRAAKHPFVNNRDGGTEWGTRNEDLVRSLEDREIRRLVASEAAGLEDTLAFSGDSDVLKFIERSQQLDSRLGGQMLWGSGFEFQGREESKVTQLIDSCRRIVDSLKRQKIAEWTQIEKYVRSEIAIGRSMPENRMLEDDLTRGVREITITRKSRDSLVSYPGLAISPHLKSLYLLGKVIDELTATVSEPRTRVGQSATRFGRKLAILSKLEARVNDEYARQILS